MALWRREFITRLLAAGAALAASAAGRTRAAAARAPRLSGGDESEYTFEVLSLLHAAREIRAGRGAQLAASIEARAVDHLAPIVGFAESTFTIAALYLGGVVLQSSPQPVPKNVFAALRGARGKVKQVLSAGCFDLTTCKAAGCVPWPTSLRPANVNAPNPLGWHYIVGSHCGFSWPKFWKLDCGPPIALQPCTGDEATSAQAALELTQTAQNAVVPRPPSASDQTKYAMQVLSLMHVAREIKAGRGAQLAASIEASTPDYLTPMADFAETNYTIGAFALADQQFKAENRTPPAALNAKLKGGRDKLAQVLSQDCFELIDCKEPGCVPWPTSLRAANLNAPSPLGWRYIVGSHCGFSWPKFWKLDCGPPIALQPCTGSESTSVQARLDQETYVPRTSDPNGYIVGTVVDPSATGPTGFVYSTVDEQGARTAHTGTTDALKRFAIFVPAGIALVQVARRLDERGNLVKPAECRVGRNLSVPSLRDLPKPPPNGPAIVGGNSAWERDKPVEFRTRGIDPRNVRLQIDGNAEGQQVLAASNSSVIALVKTSPGMHAAALVTGGTPTNGVASDFVDATVALTGSTRIGGTKVVTLQVVGVPPQHSATCTFTVSGASEFPGGKPEMTVPLVNGRATAQVRNVRAGETSLRWQLMVKIPGVWD
ncbi:MAG TPA: hypothetical protein VK669_12070 [Candidatus Limnocylindrales bacterium]|nr:hypothetical protein [Candidatus Limnocylindrales bacterium]